MLGIVHFGIRLKNYKKNIQNASNVSSVQFSRSVVSDSLRPHGLQHARPPCPSSTPGVCSNSHPLSWWCHSTSHPMSPLLLFPSVFPSIRVFFNESALHIRRPKYWSFRFSISPSNEYSRLISFRIDWFDLLERSRNLANGQYRSEEHTSELQSQR